LTDFKTYLTATLCEKFAVKWLLNIDHSLDASLHYLVKCTFSKITTIHINTCAKTNLPTVYIQLLYCPPVFMFRNCFTVLRSF